MAGDILSFDAAVGPSRRGAAPRLEARFDVPPGITVLFGPSGSGKSTCLSVIAGLLLPERGTITLGGETLTDVSRGISVPPHRRRVGLVFQSLALFPHLDVAANVQYAVRRGSSDEKKRRALGWLERTRVAHLAQRRPGTLSGGEAQRVALARALASEPRVLLLDEPFSALDSPLKRELGRELRELVQELSIPVVLVTHDREDAVLLGTRIVALAAGRVVATGDPETVLSSQENR